MESEPIPKLVSVGTIIGMAIDSVTHPYRFIGMFFALIEILSTRAFVFFCESIPLARIHHISSIYFETDLFCLSAC